MNRKKLLLMRTRILLLIAFFQLATLAFGQKYNFYGTTSRGGDSDLGTIFKTDTNGGNLTTIYNIGRKGGKQPINSKLCIANNGKYYGLTSKGGKFDLGIIYELDILNNTDKILYSFLGSTFGGIPLGSLIQAGNGKLYGMTSTGGANNEGILFEFDITTKVLTKKVDFSTVNGTKPNGTLFEASNGKLYGLTSAGGSTNLGVIFEYDYVLDSFTKKIDFNGMNGAVPFSSLFEVGNGILYGVTRDGGSLSKGNLFEYTIATNTLVSKVDFEGTLNGSKPYESPLKANNGKLYGLTSSGGINDKGVLYEYDIGNDTLIKKIDFTSGSGGGVVPRGGMVETVNGDIYGTTSQGGNVNNGGILFRFNYNSNLYHKVFDFNGRVNGAAPMGTLIKRSNSKLLGVTSLGGEGLNGVVYEYDYNLNLYLKLRNFATVSSIEMPKGRLTYAENGKFYGLTNTGGTSQDGAFFEFDPKTLDVKVKFEHPIVGQNYYIPVGDLVNGRNGYLYGISLKGSNRNDGTLFKYNYSTGTYINFGPPLGHFGTGSPIIKTSLFLHSNGNLFGAFMGRIFEYNIIANSFSWLTPILGYERSSYFVSEDTSGDIYIVSSLENDGQSIGNLKKYSLSTNTVSTIHTFTGLDGNTPVGELILAKNGKFYGVTKLGGVNNKEVIYEYDPSLSTYTKKLDFDSINGTNPEDGLAELKHGKLFGTTKFGGTNNQGVMYEYDYVLNTIQVKHNFDSASTGSFPMGRIMKSTDCKVTRNSVLVIFPLQENTLGLTQELIQTR